MTGLIAEAQVTYEEAFPNLDFEFPVELQNSNDGTNRFYVVEQPGKIKVFPNSSSVTSAQVSTLLDISGAVYYNSGQEIGLLGLAFHPNYKQNGFFYVYYTRRNNNSNTEMVLERYQVQDPKSNTANPNSGLILFSFEKVQSYSNHNGGKIAFGPDGHLYISIGDGGGAGDPHKNGQNLNNAFASLLRIDVDLDGNNPVETNPDLPNGNYEIPSDNPRVGLDGLDELYAWGLRNTWKFSFDPPTNRLWGADVGQNRFEEINLIQRGGNYGWNLYEANSIEDQSTSLVTNPDIKPIYFYDRSNGDVSVTGGYVYRGISQNPSLQGKYIFGDYASGRVWSLNYDDATNTATSELLFRTNGLYISSFGLDELGELYFCNYGSEAKIYKIIGGNNGPTTTIIEGVGKWSALDQGTNGTVACIVTDNNGNIFVGGEFSQIGGINANNIAVYNADSGWQSYGIGTNGPVNTIAISNTGTLYIGGNFSEANGIPASNIALYDGTSWASLATGTDGPVAKISLDSNNSIYVGGAFVNAGGIVVNNIAKWSNGNWEALADSGTGGIGTNNEVRSIAIDPNDQIYVGGNFDTAGNNPAARIATWDGIGWGALGDGTSGFVQAILVTQEYIYAGGNFAIAGNQTVNRIARWDKSAKNWQSLGHGVSGNVNSLSYDGSYLYVGGNFETAANMENKDLLVHNMARWSDLKGWEALGTKTSVGIDGQANTSVFLNNNSLLYVGGNFTKAGLVTASNIGIWSEVDCSEFLPEYQLDGVLESGQTTISVPKGTTVVLGVVQKDVEFTTTLPDGTEVIGTYNLGEVDASNNGTYRFTSETGCTSSLILTVTEVEDPDSDQDGVPDRIDECPNTPPGTLVDTKGCGETEIPPMGDFTIATTSTCADTQNGNIEIEASITDQYVANLTSEATNESYVFTKSLQIPNLSTGQYSICISKGTSPEQEKCYEETIETLPPLVVNLIKDKNQVQLSMSGATSYTINVNGEISNTSSQEVTLELTENTTHIKINTETECQGIFEETVVLNDDFLVYPNPFDNHIKIQLPSTINGTLEASIFSSLGILVHKGTYEVVNGILTIDTTKLTTSALYYLKLHNLEKNIAFKVLKR